MFWTTCSLVKKNYVTEVLAKFQSEKECFNKIPDFALYCVDVFGFCNFFYVIDL